MAGIQGIESRLVEKSDKALRAVIDKAVAAFFETIRVAGVHDWDVPVKDYTDTEHPSHVPRSHRIVIDVGNAIYDQRKGNVAEKAITQWLADVEGLKAQVEELESRAN